MSNMVLYTLTVLIWGSTWFAIEFQLGVVAPEVSLVYRYGLAATLLFAWCRLRRLPLQFPLHDHAWFVLLGLLLFGINYIFAYRAQTFITSALTAIAFSSIVWMNIINARLFLGARLSHQVLVGALLGISGIVMLFAPKVGGISFDNDIVLGSLLAVVGALVSSFGNMVSQAAQKKALPVLQSNAWGMFYGSVLTAGYAAFHGHAFLFDPSPGYVVSLVYLTIFGSIIAFGAYLTLLGRIGADRAGYAMIMFPVVALALSALFEDMALDWTILTGTALVLVGNAFVLTKDIRVSLRTPRNWLWHWKLLLSFARR